MSPKNSINSVNENKSIWTNNLPSFSRQKRDPTIPSVERFSNLSRMPTNRQVLGNFAFLFNSEKRRQERIKIIIKDIELLWTEVLDFPLLSKSLIRKKVNCLIDLNDKNKKKPSEKFTAILSDIFDVTNVNGEWKSSENKNLYQCQIKTGARLVIPQSIRLQQNQCIHVNEPEQYLKLNLVLFISKPPMVLILNLTPTFHPILHSCFLALPLLNVNHSTQELILQWHVS